MSCLVFLGNLATILFLDSHANIIQVCTYLDVFLQCNMARSWQDFPCFIMFLVMAVRFCFTGELSTSPCWFSESVGLGSELYQSYNIKWQMSKKLFLFKWWFSEAKFHHHFSFCVTIFTTKISYSNWGHSLITQEA